MTGDPSLTDVELQREIDLVGALVLAAAQNDGPMTQDSIDEVLGVDPDDDAAVPGSGGTSGPTG
ncbi:hypothetical protein [Phycicoccus flavus]|uniref:hypothetical protein n=1 Tax=Phycicoccus flavus TaxID=2502783 RepID=UPI000FEBD11A|nr:hypothetical protein [Phycicoccus flavus]NHA66619.1 hypothetical protein [Phycicoccus flavus]